MIICPCRWTRTEEYCGRRIIRSPQAHRHQPTSPLVAYQALDGISRVPTVPWPFCYFRSATRGRYGGDHSSCGLSHSRARSQYIMSSCRSLQQRDTRSYSNEDSSRGSCSNQVQYRAHGGQQLHFRPGPLSTRLPSNRNPEVSRELQEPTSHTRNVDGRKSVSSAAEVERTTDGARCYINSVPYSLCNKSLAQVGFLRYGSEAAAMSSPCHYALPEGQGKDWSLSDAVSCFVRAAEAVVSEGGLFDARVTTSSPGTGRRVFQKRARAASPSFDADSSWQPSATRESPPPIYFMPPDSTVSQSSEVTDKRDLLHATGSCDLLPVNAAIFSGPVTTASAHNTNTVREMDELQSDMLIKNFDDNHPLLPRVMFSSLYMNPSSALPESGCDLESMFGTRFDLAPSLDVVSPAADNTCRSRPATLPVAVGLDRDDGSFFSEAFNTPSSTCNSDAFRPHGSESGMAGANSGRLSAEAADTCTDASEISAASGQLILQRPNTSLSRFPRRKCRVDSCTADTSHESNYYKRRRICRQCTRSLSVWVGGCEMRFCQQCTQVHNVDCFDASKRSCRAKLSRHRARAGQQITSIGKSHRRKVPAVCPAGNIAP